MLGHFSNAKKSRVHVMMYGDTVKLPRGLSLSLWRHLVRSRIAIYLRKFEKNTFLEEGIAHFCDQVRSQ